MDFETCYKLLEARPPHAHAHCVDEQPTDTHKEEEEVTVTVPSESHVETNEHDALVTQSVVVLGQSFFALQERRVHIYSDFQDGFNTHKATPQFQPFCADITAQFAVVSKEINAIEAALRAKDRTALAQLIRKVQEQEKEKLLLTSALLVEKMRHADMTRRPGPDESRLALLTQSIKTMTAKHTSILEQINELLDELRMELVDEGEEDE